MTAGPRDLAWRDLRTIDRDLWLALYTDPGTMRFIGPPLSSEVAGRSFGQALDATSRGEGVHQVLVGRGAGPIGLGLLAPVRSPQGVAEVEVGIMLAECHRGRGIGRRGLALLVADARKRFGPVAISVQYRGDHVATARMVATLGFIDSGERKPPGWVRARHGVAPPTAGPAVDQTGVDTMMELVQMLERIGADPKLRHGAAAAPGADVVPGGVGRGKLYCTVFPVREDEPQPQPDESPRREDDETPAEAPPPAREH